ncbi:MAG: hypothetical protein ABEI31_00765 [Halodesulfurarchaeum sp.]
MLILQLNGSDPGATLALAQGLAGVVIAGTAAVLLYYLYRFGTDVLAVRRTRRKLWYFALGTGATVIYGAGRVLALYTEWAWPAVIAEGATLFFILFFALGFRALYLSMPETGRWASGEGPGDPFRRYLPDWLDYLIIGGYIVAWWAGFLLVHRVTDLVLAIGWLLASAWALVWAVLIVRRHEGTSIAALTRHLFPAVAAFTLIVVADVLAALAEVERVGTAMWIVGTVLVGAFFFTTAIAIRQESGEVERIYDHTTYRGRRQDED